MAQPEDLKAINDFGSLIAYLRESLGWEIPEDLSYEQLTYSYTADELGLRLDAQVEITQMRPILGQKDAWGVFFVDFDKAELPVTLLRRILSSVSRKKRASANASDRALFDKNDLLFISAFGKAANRRLALAHFHQAPETTTLPTLRVLTWDQQDTSRHMSTVAERLARLRWPDGRELDEAWKGRWASAFVDRPREAIRTAREMAQALAECAKQIRQAIEEILPQEKAGQPLSQLFEAVKATLNRDLDVPKFADTYAQTVAYGLLSKRIDQVQRWRAAKSLTLNGALPLLPITVDALESAIPTNPFLSELLNSFMSAMGPDADASGLDFDELGLGDLVDLLNTANIGAVLDDFDKDKQGDDPVIHFYEGFLAAYDKAMKVQRGVFYTPKPVVSFIVRSVDEVLRTEFGLALGLADTTTWSEFTASHPVTKIPDGVGPNEPFVKILDPATGTGTFLVEVIELIHHRMTSEVWKGRSADERHRLWNAYVAEYLLPRLYGYELMMAPYAVAHMKIGLKLADTGYDFLGTEAGLDGTTRPMRARVFLTNALEPARDLDMQLAFMNEALAHEARAANDTKAHARFTVVMGNPPYSNLSANLTPEALTFIEHYRHIDGQRIKERNMLQFERNINDDYVKFLGLCSALLDQGGMGIACLITNNVYSWSTSLRGLRRDLMLNFSVALLDLHGASQRGLAGLAEHGDENVFDIEQPVAICRLVKGYRPAAPASYSELIGPEHAKLATLKVSTMEGLQKEGSSARPRYWRLTPDRSPYALEYENFLSLEDAVPLFSEAVKTGRDWLVVDFNAETVIERMSDIASSKETDKALSERIGLNVKKAWNLSAARQAIAGARLDEHMQRIHYRAFDSQWVFYHPSWIASSASPVMQHLAGAYRDKNLAIVAGRTSRDGRSVMFFCSQGLADKGLLSTLDNVSAFPLWVQPTETDDRWSANLAPELVEGIARQSKLSPLPAQTADPTERGDLTTSFGARDVFDWIYAVVHSPTYRERYADFLKSDFARVPLPAHRDLFAALIPLGTRLVALHLLDDDALPELFAEPKVRFVANGDEPRLGRFNNDVRRDASGRVYLNDRHWFTTVPQTAWDHWIGGYQPARKWLKDRSQTGSRDKLKPGRLLSNEDILHYRRMIVALEETGKVMVEIDSVIDDHGGWPNAFKGTTD